MHSRAGSMLLYADEIEESDVEEAGTGLSCTFILYTRRLFQEDYASVSAYERRAKVKRRR